MKSLLGLCLALSITVLGKAAEPPALTTPWTPPSGKGDPLLGSYWHLTATRTREAWNLTKGSPHTVIAFVDSGIDYTHADLTPNLAWNSAEWPMNGIDKDQNGFIDDVIGFDFSVNRPLPFDLSGHGSFLAGLAVAVEDNGIGGAGVCPRCRVLSAKFIDANGFGDTEDAIRAIEYATLKKASVINVSFSGEGYDGKLYEALKRTLDANIVVVAAASNDGLNLDHEDIYPAKYELPNLITVAATDKRDRLWKYSNWGKRTVHLGAPAVEVVSIWKEDPSGYDVGSGTSDAAAIVSGVVGLVRSIEPSLTAEQAVQVVLKSARHVAPLEGKTVTGAIVDAASAVACAKNRLCLQRQGP